MKNYVQDGDKITIAAPYDVISGAGALQGSLFGVAETTALSGEPVSLQLEGVVDIAKTSAEAWMVGALIYWNDTTKRATSTASTNKRIGVAVAVAANPSAVGRVRLSGAFEL